MSPERYDFTPDDLTLLDRVHALITRHRDRFVAAGKWLDDTYSVDAMLARHAEPLDEDHRQALIARAMQNTEADLPRTRVEEVARHFNDKDAAVAYVLRSEAVQFMQPSRDEWEPRSRRLCEAIGDIANHELPVETPSPDWEWSSRVLLVFWLISEPRADTQSELVTDFQRWRWEWEPPDDLYPDEAHPSFLPRSILPFTIHDWPALLNGARRGMRCADRIGLLSTTVVPPAVIADLPLLNPKEAAAHRLILARSPIEPITSKNLCDRLAAMDVSLADDVFRKQTVPKLKKLGLQVHLQLGYYYPLSCLARRLEAEHRRARRESTE